MFSTMRRYPIKALFIENIDAERIFERKRSHVLLFDQYRGQQVRSYWI